MVGVLYIPLTGDNGSQGYKHGFLHQTTTVCTVCVYTVNMYYTVEARNNINVPTGGWEHEVGREQGSAQPQHTN